MNQNTSQNNSLAKELGEGRPLVGLILKLNSPAMAELGGSVGFDFLIFDTEHGLGGGAELENHLRAADAVNTPALVRVSTLNRTEVARALDAGATGVIIPQVESQTQAEEAVRLAHYPPRGVRGLATSTRAGGQGTTPGKVHVERASNDTVVIVQIESGDGVLNVEDILGTPGVSGVWIGLSDLSLSLGHLGQFDHPLVADATTRIFAAAAKSHTPVLIIADDDADAQRWLDAGAQSLLVNQLVIAKNSLAAIRSTHQKAQIERTHHGY